MVDLTPHWQRLAGDLTAVASVGGADLQEAVSRLLPALEAPVRLRLVEVLAQATEELNALLPALRIQSHGSGDQVAFGVEAEPAASDLGGDLDARITLRLPEDLKFRIEAAANAEGLSLNAWLLKTLARSTAHALSGLHAPTPPPAPTAPRAPSAPAAPTVGRQLRGRGRA